MNDRYDERFQTQQKTMQQRYESQQEALIIRASRTDEQILNLKSMVDERDRRYSERFDASQTALQAALTAQEKSVDAALAAADRAVAKAETASEKRFESVNEFRQTLTDQAASFATRNEVDTKIESIVSKILDNADQAQKDIGMLASRIDRTEGSKFGVQESRLGLNANVAMIGTLVAIIVAIITVIATR